MHPEHPDFETQQRYAIAVLFVLAVTFLWLGSA